MKSLKLMDNRPIIFHATTHPDTSRFDAALPLGCAIRPEIRLITHIARWLSVSFMPRKRFAQRASLKDLAGIRRQLLCAIEDCLDQPALRVRTKIESARSAQELWMLRNDAFQLISQQHNQSVAAERINALIQFFEGWLEPKQLVRIK